MIGTYTVRPVMVEALQWTGGNMKELEGFMNQSFVSYSITGGLLVQIQGRDKRIDPGTWVIKDAVGEFSLCDNDKFQRGYDRVE